MAIQCQGVMPAVMTKFTEKDKLDLDLFSVNIKVQLEAGVHGIVLAAHWARRVRLYTQKKERPCNTPLN